MDAWVGRRRRASARCWNVGLGATATCGLLMADVKAEACVWWAAVGIGVGVGLG